MRNPIKVRVITAAAVALIFLLAVLAYPETRTGEHVGAAIFLGLVAGAVLPSVWRQSQQPDPDAAEHR